LAAHNIANLQNKRMQTFLKLPWNIASWLYGQALFLTPLQWGLVSTCAVCCAISGWRLARFSHPEYPRWSALLRHATRVFMLWSSLISIATVFLGCLALFALSLCLDLSHNLWDVLRPRTQALEWGIATGLFFGGWFFYYLIPGWELPVVTAAAPDAAMSTTGNYDPERFFRV
jgi:hypothetical protein